MHKLGLCHPIAKNAMLSVLPESCSVAIVQAKSESVAPLKSGELLIAKIPEFKDVVALF